MATSHQKRGFAGKPFTFVHVPKTAGTAFSSAFDPISEPYESDLDLRHSILNRSPDLLNRFQGILFWHITYSDLVQHYGEAAFADRFNFAFIRNPWDWLVSMYAFVRQHTAHPESMLVNHMSFPQFLDFWIAKRVRQWDFLQHDGSVELNLYKFENLSASCDEIAEKIGIEPPKLEVLNTSERKEYAEYYDSRTRRLVEQNFAEDIALGEYTFHAEYRAGARVVENRFEKGEDPYLATEIVVSRWKHEGAEAALECCDELAGKLSEITFGPPHGDAFHVGMVRKILEGLTQVIHHETGALQMDAAQASDLHDAVRAALWPRLWQLVERGDRPALRRMARLYPLAFRNEASAAMQCMETFLAPHQFWDELIDVISETGADPSAPPGTKLKALGLRMAGEFGLGNHKAACDSLERLLKFAGSREAGEIASNELSEVLERARGEVRQRLAAMSREESRDLLRRIKTLSDEARKDGQVPAVWRAVVAGMMGEMAASLGETVQTPSPDDSEETVPAKAHDRRKKRYFTTTAGDRIPLVDGYRAMFPRFYWDTPEQKKALQADQQTFPLFLNHVYKYALSIDHLSGIGMPTSWERALDVGAMDATLSRLFLADRKVAAADAIDLLDNTGKLTDETFNAHMSRFRDLVASVQEGRTSRQEVLNLVPLYHEMRAVPTDQSPFWNLGNANSAIGRFTEGDFMAFRSEETYDLVTSFLTMVTLDLDSVMAGIVSRLEDGGTFVMMEPYWWYPYLFFGVVGEFPYAFQRLSGDDLVAYIEEHHSEDREFLLQRLGLFRMHTVNDYIAAADRHGLSLMGERRFLQTQDTGDFRAKLSPQFMSRHEDARLADITANIQRFRPDVQSLDLMTSYVVLAFRKAPNDLGSLSNSIAQIAGN
jgi:hypothetical protein